MLLSVTVAPDRLAVPTVVGASIASAKMVTRMSQRMPRSKAGVPKEEARMASKNDC